jgi:hypothetical protein
MIQLKRAYETASPDDGFRILVDATVCENVRVVQMTPTGFEQFPENTGKTQGRQNDSAPDSAFPPDLQRIIDAWQHLSVRTKATILAILDAAGDAPSDA